MSFAEAFKGRFGKFFLYKIWAFTIVCGPVLSTLEDFMRAAGARFNDEFFAFILLEIVYGFVLCIPSLLITEIFYKTISKKSLKNTTVFSLTLLIALLLTNLTYYFFLNKPLEPVDHFYIAFAVSYSICLLLGFFIFKPKNAIAQ